MIEFRSRISLLMTAIILLVLLMLGTGYNDSPLAILILAITLLFTLSILFSIRYIVADNKLTIKNLGFKIISIDIINIISIKRSYNPLSSPAASLKRLELKFYHKGRVATILISPADENKFIDRLKNINRNIDVKISADRGICPPWDWDI